MNIFITGGLTGLGREVTLGLLADGHHVAISSFQAEEEIQDQLLEGTVYYQADVRDKEKMKEVIYAYKELMGSLDVIYANAGINQVKKSKRVIVIKLIRATSSHNQEENHRVL